VRVKEFFATACVEPALSKRVTSLYTRMVAWRFNERGQAPSGDELAQLYAFAREHIVAHEEWFNKTRENFFFIDLVPENAERFPVTIDECRRVA
jgi:hypothetical protein